MYKRATVSLSSPLFSESMTRESSVAQPANPAIRRSDRLLRNNGARADENQNPDENRLNEIPNPVFPEPAPDVAGGGEGNENNAAQPNVPNDNVGVAADVAHDEDGELESEADYGAQDDSSEDEELDNAMDVDEPAGPIYERQRVEEAPERQSAMAMLAFLRDSGPQANNLYVKNLMFHGPCQLRDAVRAMTGPELRECIALVTDKGLAEFLSGLIKPPGQGSHEAPPKRTGTTPLFENLTLDADEVEPPRGQGRGRYVYREPPQATLSDDEMSVDEMESVVGNGPGFNMQARPNGGRVGLDESTDTETRNQEEQERKIARKLVDEVKGCVVDSKIKQIFVRATKHLVYRENFFWQFQFLKPEKKEVREVVLYLFTNAIEKEIEGGEDFLGTFALPLKGTCESRLQKLAEKHGVRVRTLRKSMEKLIQGTKSSFGSLLSENDQQDFRSAENTLLKDVSLKYNPKAKGINAHPVAWLSMVENTIELRFLSLKTKLGARWESEKNRIIVLLLAPTHPAISKELDGDFGDTISVRRVILQEMKDGSSNNLWDLIQKEMRKHGHEAPLDILRYIRTMLEVQASNTPADAENNVGLLTVFDVVKSYMEGKLNGVSLPVVRKNIVAQTLAVTGLLEKWQADRKSVV